VDLNSSPVSFGRQLLEAELAAAEASRLIDLCLILRRAKTNETILWAGGRWDRIDQRFTDQEPETGQVIDLEESQIAFARWFAAWLRDYRDQLPRDISLVLNEGDRRGGKTTVSVLAQIAALIEVPRIGNGRTLGWVISESYKKRDEIEETIRRWIPNNWFRHWRAPEFRYEFANGAVLRNLSAQDPEDLRQGRADILVYNEPQQMVSNAVINGMYGTADRGGLTILACNPPTLVKGEWLFDLREAIQNNEPEAEGAITFHFTSKLNTKIDQQARRRLGKLARIINPEQAEADDAGIWARIGDRAYPKWNKSLIRECPALGDITEQAIYRRSGKHGYRFLGGVDFQGYPFNSAVLYRVYPGGPDGMLYWAVDEFLTEGAEIHLLHEVMDAGYRPEDILWIGDASAQWQNYKHEQGLRSFAEFQKEGWQILPPRERRPDSKSQYVGNPPVESRLRVMLRLMEQQRVFVDPTGCHHLAESFKECPLRKDGTRVKKSSQHAHETDAADYALYWLDPKPKAVGRTPTAEGIAVLNVRPIGPRTL
jgi:hypothetical protein